MSRHDLNQIPARMEHGVCRECRRESHCCGLVVYRGQRHRPVLLCSKCRLALAGFWSPCEPLDMSDFQPKRERLVEFAECAAKSPPRPEKSLVEAAYDGDE